MFPKETHLNDSPDATLAGKLADVIDGSLEEETGTRGIDAVYAVVFVFNVPQDQVDGLFENGVTARRSDERALETIRHGCLRSRANTLAA